MVMPSILNDRTMLKLLRRELNSLMWIDPFTDRGEHDPGWSCRDHAYVLGMLLQAEGIKCSLIHGLNMLVMGPRPPIPPVGIGQEIGNKMGHMWVRTDDKPIIDLSPKGEVTGSVFPGIPFGGIVGEALDPSAPCMVLMTEVEANYRAAINFASHQANLLTCIYLQRREIPIREAVSGDPFAFVFSPLGQRLQRKYPSSIYLKAVVHLQGLLKQERTSLASVSQGKAWRLIADIADAEALAVKDRVLESIAS